MASLWSQFPADLLSLILSRLHIDDYVRFSTVCTSWWKAAADDNPRREPPWLMLSDDDGNKELRNFFSLADQKLRKIHVPRISNRRCLGSSDGWVVTINDIAELQLLNPFNGAEARLPSITTISSIVGVECDHNSGAIVGYMYQVQDGRNHPPMFNNLEYMQDYYFRKVVFFPTASIVVAIHDHHQFLAFARIGDDSWTNLPPSYNSFNDVILHNGQIHAVTREGFIVALDMGDVSSPLIPSITFIGLGHPMFPDGWHYLVESPDGSEVLQVCKYTSWNGVDGTCYMTKSFKVFRLELDSRSGVQWAEVKRLGEKKALFLGQNHSMSLSTDDWPELRGNCIYFTCDSILEHTVASRVGVFDLEDGSVGPCFPTDSMLSHLNWPPPIWIKPSLSLRK